mmetsp:Transcript_19619/g.48254  ORF Transcript_19619/g.48254 Transcript_19619/m.48254 type:complete len:444 (-) Transcript_19619:58-1389(-)
MGKHRAFNALTACGGILGESYFSEFGDDDVSKTDAPALSWRGDPLQTHSDWTIVVVTSEFDSRTYHVHKSILSVGPRSSKYFANLFLEQGHHYNQSQTTRIELDEQDADSFPLFLDFMYNIQPDNDDDSLSLIVGEDFTTSNAVSLRHLARVFDCEGLMLGVNKFIQKDLSLKTGPVYLTQAFLYQDERLVESAKRLCIDNFKHIDKRSIVKLPLPLFRSIIHSVTERFQISGIAYNDEDSSELSFQVSDVVCQFFERNPEHVSIDLLLELTSEGIMPQIASEPAIGFTALARELDSSKIEANSEQWKGVVTLCKRCAEAVVSEYGWKDFNVVSALDEFVYGPCASAEGSKMDSLLFATSFAAALEKAQVDLRTVNHGTEKVREQVSGLRKDNDDLLTKKQGLKQDVDKYRRELDYTKEELIMLKQELRGLKKKHRMSLHELS